MAKPTTPLISIVTPSYNQSEFLEENLQSVMCQSSSTIEHIVVDGGSTDGTIEILREYEDKYNLRWVSEPDDGQSHAINKGFEMAEGKWIGWQNADDYYLPGGLDALKTATDTHQEMDYIYGDLLFVNENGDSIRRRYHTRPSKFIQKHWKMVFANHTLLIRRSVLKSIGGINEDYEYVMDADLFWRLLKADLQSQHVPQLVAAHRVHEDAKTSSMNHNKYREECESLYEYSSLEKRIPDSATKALAVFLKTIYFLSDGHLYPVYDMYADLFHSRVYPFRSWNRNAF